MYKIIKNAIALNFLNFKNLIQNIKIHNTEKKEMLIEFQLHSSMMVVINFIIATLISSKYKITFFYYSQLDNKYRNFLFKISYYFFLKNFEKFNFNLINLYIKKKNSNMTLAKKIYKKIKNKNNLNNLKYKNHNIGKFIYQSYCRELNEPTVILKDEKLVHFISEAINYVDHLTNFFKRNNFKKIVISHTIFIRYGILASVAKKFNCKVYIIFPGNNDGLLNKLRLLRINEYLQQCESYWLFRKDFAKLKNKKKIYKISEKNLYQRIFKGKRESKTMWGQLTPYELKNIYKFKSSKPKIIILPSCFFDSVNFFRHSLFIDCYEWLDFVLSHAQKTDFDWYIKPHPDGKVGNEKILKYFKKKYPFLKILKREVSNYSFKKYKFCSMFTWRGSAIGEFTYMNIPTVAASDNFHISYKFGRPTNNKKILRDKILNADKLKLKYKKKDLLEFNYMYNFDASRDWKIKNFFSKPIPNKIQKFNESNNFFSEYLRNKLILNNLKKKHILILQNLIN